MNIMNITGKFENKRLICSRMERLYLYKNSTQICAQTGFQGYLRGYFKVSEAPSGEDFFFDNFFPFNRSFAEGFFDSLQKVMDTLRKGILKSFASMKSFCYGDGYDSLFTGNFTTEYAFRVDHKGFAFLFRLIPMMGDYHVYCHCYRADWLEQHLDKAESGIRFITPNYEELFRLEDGGKIRITAADGSVKEQVCRYLDDYHFETDGGIYHICEWAEKMAAAGKTVEPVADEELKEGTET